MGVGLTVIVKLFAVPVQPLDDGVTVMVATAGLMVLLIAVKEGILPVPAAARPMLALLLVQLKVVPPTVPVKFTAAVGAPLQAT